MVPSHVVAKRDIESLPCTVEHLSNVFADRGELLYQEGGLFGLTGSLEFHQGDAELFSLDKSLSVREVGAGHSDVVDLVSAGRQADVLIRTDLTKKEVS